MGVYLLGDEAGAGWGGGNTEGATHYGLGLADGLLGTALGV